MGILEVSLGKGLRAQLQLKVGLDNSGGFSQHFEDFIEQSSAFLQVSENPLEHIQEIKINILILVKQWVGTLYNGIK